MIVWLCAECLETFWEWRGSSRSLFCAVGKAFLRGIPARLPSDLDSAALLMCSIPLFAACHRCFCALCQRLVGMDFFLTCLMATVRKKHVVHTVTDPSLRFYRAVCGVFWCSPLIVLRTVDALSSRFGPPASNSGASAS